MAFDLFKSGFDYFLSDRTYAYSPLDENAKEIRILTLLPGISNTAIRLQLTTEILDSTSSENPSYEALSYTWGSMRDLKQVLIQERGDKAEWKTLRVTQNLAAALVHLRDEIEPRCLWIDAICVDQQNLQERSTQVLRMGEVYALADHVVVWLGIEENNSSRAIRLFEKLGTMVELEKITRKMKPSTCGINEPEWADQSIPTPWSEQDWEAVLHFLFRPWFERIWIQQEIRLCNTSKAIVQCGSSKMQWSTLYISTVCLHYKVRPECLSSCRFARFLDYAGRIVLILELGEPDMSLSFYQLLRSTSMCECTDPRDRVYALLGICPEFTSKPIPDYKKSIAEVYQEVILKYEESYANINILTIFEMPQEIPRSFHEDMTSSLWQYVSFPEGHAHQKFEPSWAPSHSQKYTPTLLQNSWAGTGLVSQIIRTNTNILEVAGLGLQETVRTLRVISHSDMDHNFLERLVPELYKLVKQSDVLHGRHTSLNVFCRTLAANSFSDQYLPPPDTLPDFEECKLALSNALGLSTVSILDANEGEDRVGLLDMMSTYAILRSFFITTTGKIGLAPQSAQLGDQIVVFLGCRSPMLIRPVSASRHFQLVGEVFFWDACFTQAFLGPVPEGFEHRNCMQYDEARTPVGYRAAIVNINTMEELSEDPRLGPLPDGWVSSEENPFFTAFLRPDELVQKGEEWKTYNDPRLKIEALGKRGLNVERFKLV